MRQWIEVFNTGDLRHLLLEYDESIDSLDLSPYFDALMQEYEGLKGGDEYSHHLEKVDDTMYKEYVIKVCTFVITCLKWGEIEGAERLIDEFNLKIAIDKSKLCDKNAISKLEKRIKQIKTSLKISAIQEKEENQGHKKPVWEDMMVYIDQALGTKVDYNCTVALYVSYEKSAGLRIKAKNKK